MKSKDWPLPPKFNFDIQEIPEEFECFKRKFKYNGEYVQPMPITEYEDINIEELETLVGSSIKKFKSLIKNQNDPKNAAENIQQIEEIHKKINSKINKAKLWEIKKKLGQ